MSVRDVPHDFQLTAGTFVPRRRRPSSHCNQYPWRYNGHMRWTNSQDEIAHAHDAVVFSRLRSKLQVVWLALEALPHRFELALGEADVLLLRRPLQVYTLH